MLITGNDTFFVNQTYRFIYPILRLYGDDFMKRLSMLYKQGVFIDDIMNIRYDDLDYIHIVINVKNTIEKYGKEFVFDTIDWLRSSGFMPKDYILSVLSSNKKPHHIVLMVLIPEKYQGCISRFITGNVSLFSKNDVSICFSTRKKEFEAFYASCRQIITKQKSIEIDLKDEVLNY